MKFRVISDGPEDFKIQRKIAIFWFDVKVPFGTEASITLLFSSNVLARTWIKNNHPDAEIVD